MNQVSSTSLAVREHCGVIIPDRRQGYDRRRTTLRTFMQGGLTPRRRNGRRAGEQSLVDWHEPHLLFLALTILLLNVADAFLTLTLITVGATEANPLMAYILDDFPRLFAAVKMSMTGVGVVILVAMARAKVFFRLIRVSTVLHWFLVAYVALIAYEWWLLRTIL